MADDDTLAGLAAPLDRLEAENADLRDRTAALEAENRALRAPGAPPHEPRALGRRDLIARGLAAAGAATAGAVLLDGAPAAAANGNPLVLGSGANAATATTVLSASGGPHGVMLLDSGTPFGGTDFGATLAVRATNQSYQTGIHLRSNQTGIQLEAGQGIRIASSIQGISISSDGDGVQIRSDDRALEAVTSGGDEAIYAANNRSGAAVGVLASVIGTGAIGVDATSTNGTGVKGATNAASGYGVQATSTAGTAVHASTTRGFGVEAFSTNGTALKARGTDYGVIAQSVSTDPEEAALAASSLNGMAIFVDSDSGDLLRGASSTGGGVAVSAPKFHLRLTNDETRGAPTGDTTINHVRGDIVETTSGDLWLCVAAGKPGTWRKLAGPATAGAFHVLPAPARIYDSRPGFAPTVGPKTPFAANTTRVFDLKVNASGVPAGATAVMVNLLLVNAAIGNGNLTIWANGAAKPVANTLVWGGDARRFSALAVTAIDTQARVQVNTSLATDLVIDVVGYYR